jgi:hypothetical protein
MTAEIKPSLYETDYLQWIETTIEQLRQRKYEAVDWKNLIEELADMGRSERKSLKSNLVIVLLHLLKWQYQPQNRSGSWKGSIVEHRRRIRDDLADSPSLKPYLREIFARCYADAVEQASAETGLPSDTFPSECPYTEAQALESSFFPD